ncbi:MAG: hypothetical protein IJ727_07185 [Treponema sp.]|nr:hypothetical protein [Treponema sp.]
MKMKFLFSFLIFVIFSAPAFSKAGFEFGLGSGYVFYGDKDTKNRNKLLGDTNQSVLYLDAACLIPVSKNLTLSFGADTVFDFRWKGSNHIYLVDHAMLAGFRLYPNLGGLFASIDYALGRRSDFIEIEDYSETLNSKWGNGFKFAVGYDFTYHIGNIAPVLAASIKSMPRGNNSRDNIICVSLKLTKR